MLQVIAHRPLVVRTESGQRATGGPVCKKSVPGALCGRTRRMADSNHGFQRNVHFRQMRKLGVRRCARAPTHAPPLPCFVVRQAAQRTYMYFACLSPTVTKAPRCAQRKHTYSGKGAGDGPAAHASNSTGGRRVILEQNKPVAPARVPLLPLHSLGTNNRSEPA